MSVILNRTEKKGIPMTWIPKTAINEIKFNLIQLCLYKGIRFPLLLRVSSSDSISGITIPSLCVVSTCPNKGKQNKTVYSMKGSGTEQATETNNLN